MVLPVHRVVVLQRQGDAGIGGTWRRAAAGNFEQYAGRTPRLVLLFY